MKIAIFSDCYLDLTGGIVTSINAQKQALEALGHEVTIYTTAYPKTSQELAKLAKKHIYVVPSCKYLIRGVSPISRRPKIIEKWLLNKHSEIQHSDIFYIHYEAGCSIAGLRLGKKLHIPTVQVMHGREDMGVTSIVPFGFRTITATLLNWFHSWYLPHSVKIHRDDYLADTIAKAKMWTMMVNHANYADYLVCPSHHFAKKLQHYGVKKQFHIVPNGYPDTNFPSDPPLKSLHPSEPLKMIWHSRLSHEKRILPFLKALTAVDGKYHLDVYGGGQDYNKAKRYTAKYHLNVTFHGNTPFKKVQSAIQESHLDILASYNFDNYPLTLVEAEACGVPVFICDPDMQEIVPHDSFILSKSETPEDMANALNHLLAHPEKIEQMSKVMLEHRKEVLISHRIIVLEELFNSVGSKLYRRESTELKISCYNDNVRYLADLLTLSRLILSIVLIVISFTGGTPEAAFIIFLSAELTDTFDGTCARKWPFPKDKTPSYRKYAAKYDMFSDVLLTGGQVLFMTMRINWILGLVIIAYYLISSIGGDLLVYGKILGHPDDCTNSSLTKRNFPLAKKIILTRRYLYTICLGIVNAVILFATNWPDPVKYGLFAFGCSIFVFIWFFLRQRRQNISRDAVDIEKKLASSTKPTKSTKRPHK